MVARGCWRRSAGRRCSSWAASFPWSCCRSWRFGFPNPGLPRRAAQASTASPAPAKSHRATVHARIRAHHPAAVADQFPQPADDLFHQFLAAIAAAQPGHRHRHRHPRRHHVPARRHCRRPGQRAPGQPIRHREDRRRHAGDGRLLALAARPHHRLRPLVLAFFIFGTGLGISAGQLGVNALSGAIYPPAIRNTGTGWALGVGRLGNIAGPLVRRPSAGAGLGAQEHAAG